MREEANSHNYFYFIRHGQTTSNEQNIASGGDSDPSLTEWGRSQARKIGEFLKSLENGPGMIITSANRRTIETAQILNQNLQLPTECVPLLNERRLGDWNNVSSDIVNVKLAEGETPLNGESKPDFHHRIMCALKQQHGTLTTRKPLVVGSRGVARVLLEMSNEENAANLPNGRLLKMSLGESADFSITNVEYLN